MKYEEEYKISSHDADTNNNIKPSLILRYLQETANHQMRDRKPSYYDLFFEGKAFILTRVSYEILEHAHQYDRINVKTWRCQEKGATFIRCFTMEKEGKIIVKAYSEWAVADHNTGRLARADEIDISNYDMDEPVELSLPLKFRLPKDLVFKEVGTVNVSLTEVDMNRHMNNTYYPDILWNYIPDPLNKKVTSVNIRYRKEAPLWSDLTIAMAEMKASQAIDPRAEQLYCFKTFIYGNVNIEAIIGVAPL